MTALKVTAHGLTQADAELAAMVRRTRDLRPAMEPGAAELATLIDDSFQRSESPDGVPFVPLKPATIAKRRKGSSKPLVDTNRARRSISVVAGPKSLRFGSNVDYLGFHVEGTKYIPIRNVFPVELIGGRWQFMARGRAQVAFDRIRKYIESYVATGSPTGQRR